MSVKPIPYGLDDYKTIIREGYAHVDKTMYIRSLEQVGAYNLVLRPRRFGKSLFSSMLGYYYDINEKNNFKILFSNTYIGRNPTKKKNAYYILKFNFSGIRTDSYVVLLESFTRNIHSTLFAFCAAYDLDITLEMDSPEIQLLSFFTQFQSICDGKIYVIIDEYDDFANQLLIFDPLLFSATVPENGFVRAWYEVLKRVAGTIVDRIFITGISPVTLMSIASGFNISQNLSMDKEFNEMIGFTRTEVKQLVQETISEKLPFDSVNTLADYYNGYCFSEDSQERVFNSNMVFYYLHHYQRNHKSPDKLLDRDAISDYGKLEKIIKTQTLEQNLEVLKEILFDGYTTAKLIDNYSLGQEFEVEHFKSLLFYLGFLTIKDTYFGLVKLQIPNAVMKGMYFKFLMQVIITEAKYNPNIKFLIQAIHELVHENSCEKFTILIEGLLDALSKQGFIEFSDKEIKVAMAAYVGMSNLYTIKLDYEVENGCIELAFLPRADMPELDTLLFEVKYIKKGNDSKEAISTVLSDAMEHLRRYETSKEFSGKKINSWALIFAREKCVERMKV
jgi:hypothetical protein